MATNESLAEIEDTAARWLLRCDGAQWSLADQVELDEWLGASTSHRVSFMRLGRVWREVGRLEMPDSELPREWAPSPRGTGSAQTWRSRAEHLGIAATLLLTAFLALIAYLHRSERFSTPIGRILTVHTHDGSTVTLNTDTEIEVELSTAERRVELLHGEALFQVTSDPARPFTVYAGRQRIVALGTEFSVWAKAELVHITVIDGSVRVVTSSQLLSKKSPTVSFRDLRPDGDTTLTDTDSAVLDVGSVADVRGAEIAVRRQTVAGIEAALTWRTGHVEWHMVPLPEAITEFNRYQSRKLVIGDSDLRTDVIGGNYSVGDIEGFLRALRNLGIHSEVQGDVIVLTRSHSNKSSR